MSDLIDNPAPSDDQIKLVRLITGEDILCVLRDNIEDGTIHPPTEHIILSTPLKLIMHRTAPLRPASAMAIGIMQWLPDELLECHAVSVKIGHIVTIMEPKEELKTYYKKTVDLIQSHMMTGDKIIRQDITTASIDAERHVHEHHAHPEANTTKPDFSAALDNIKKSRMEELLAHLNDIDDYLMTYGGEDDGPITFH